MAAAPLSRGAQEAERRLAAAAARRRAARRFTNDQLLARGRAFLDARRHPEAERTLRRLLARPKLSSKRRCRALYAMGSAIFRQRQRDRAEPVFARGVRACRRAGLRDLEVKCWYQQARGLVRQRKYRRAAARFRALAARHRDHSYADDALLRAAEALQEAGDRPAARKLLAAIPDRHPRGDQAREALFRLARGALLDGRAADALPHLDRIIARLGRARIYYAEGRALYWRARVRAGMGQRARAAADYERAIRTYPFSYYALLAFNRLRRLDPARERRLSRALLAPATRRVAPWRIPLGPLARSAAFRRGVELARLGMSASAARELRAAGLSTAPGGRRPDLWRAALILDAAGLWHLSHQVPRSRDRSYRITYPRLPEELRRWRVAYPRAFPWLVSRAARRAGTSRALVWAVMREESAFWARGESHANAIGLMQIILPTARAAAARHGRTVDRAGLTDPAVNIRLGASYLGWLSGTFSRALPLVIAGYNAGHGAVQRWQRRWPKEPLDRFLERVPYDETRRYTKRVLASYFAYRVLQEGARRAPRIPLAQPPVVRRSFRSPRRGKR